MLSGEPMHANLKNDIRVMKLRHIISSRFGKDLDFQSVIPLAKAGTSIDQPHMRGSDYLIPLFVNQSYLGTAIVPAAVDLTFEMQLQISQVVRLVMEPLLYRDFLARSEQNGLWRNDSLPENVIPLESSFRAPTVHTEPKIFSRLVLFHGKSPVQKKKASVLLHDMTTGIAQLEFSAIADDINSVEDLKRLEDTSLVITDLEMLERMDLIESYFRLPLHEQGALLILCSTLSADDLHARGLISKELHQALSAYSLNTDRAPINEYRLRQVLQHLFF